METILPEQLITFKNPLIIDVRSPCEFKLGHIAAAVNIPLFEDHERAEVGTIYKQNSKQMAIKKGLEFVGPKMSRFIEQVEELKGNHDEIVVYCFRGGMRSQSFSWLLKTYGLKNIIIRGGYKSFRKYTRDFLGNSFKLHVLGGLTGSGKTEILQQLQDLGEQVVDLEAMAHHKGSVFGHLGNLEQPSSEHFENELFWKLKDLNKDKIIWVEDEAQRIGSVSIPDNFFFQMRDSLMIQVEVPLEQRITRLVRDYGVFSKEQLIEAITKIQKKLGGDQFTKLKNLILENNIEQAVREILEYYDRTYSYGMSKRQIINVEKVFVTGQTPTDHALELINRIKIICSESDVI